MRLRVFYTLLFGLLLFSQQSEAQTEKKAKTQLVKYNKNVEAPLTASEMAMLKEVYQDKLQTYVLSYPQRIKDFKHFMSESPKLYFKKDFPLIKAYSKDL